MSRSALGQRKERGTTYLESLRLNFLQKDQENHYNFILIVFNYVKIIIIVINYYYEFQEIDSLKLNGDNYKEKLEYEITKWNKLREKQAVSVF